LDPDNQEKKEKYSKQDKVVTRRRVLNQKRSALARTLMSMLKEGLLTYGDAQLSLVNGVVCDTKSSHYYIVDNNNDITTKSYTNEIDLHDIIPAIHVKSEEDEKFEKLCADFVKGEPAVLELIKKKRTFTEVPNPIAEKIPLLQKKVKNRIDGVDSSLSETSENEPAN
jgi:hypothetical protein